MIKPFDQVELQARARNLIEQRRLLLEKFKYDFFIRERGLDIKSTDERFIQKAIETVKSRLANPDSLDYESMPRFNLKVFVRELFGPHTDTANLIINIIDVVTSIPAAEDQNFLKIYPNPTGGILYLDVLENSMQISEVEKSISQEAPYSIKPKALNRKISLGLPADYIS
jgi:hypothetical protein